MAGFSFISILESSQSINFHHLTDSNPDKLFRFSPIHPGSEGVIPVPAAMKNEISIFERHTIKI